MTRKTVNGRINTKPEYGCKIDGELVEAQAHFIAGDWAEMIATLALWWALQCPPTVCIVSPDPPMTVPYIYLPIVAG